jgi:hypothetical protein
VDYITIDFDTTPTYATGGGVQHEMYFILSIHFISITVILYIIYIRTLCAGFLSTMALWTTEVIVGRHPPLLGLVDLSNHLHERRS